MSAPASRSTASIPQPTKRASPTPAPRSPGPGPSTIAAEGQVKRYAELVKRNFVSRQLYDNALSAAGEARADVEAQAAALRSAEIDLGRTTVRAPDRRAASAARFIPPARWSRPAQDNPLTTIQRLDPIFVDIQQSSADLLRLREQMLAGQVASDKAPGPAAARKRLDVSDDRDLELRRRDGRPGDRFADHPRGLPQSAAHPAARHVRSRPDFAGRPVARHPGPAARGQPRRARPADGAGRRRQGHVRASRHSGRPHRRRQLAGDRRAQARRQGDRRRRAAGPARNPSEAAALAHA